MRKALIDADILLYEIGFAAQQSYYTCDGTAYETKAEALSDGADPDSLVLNVVPYATPAALSMVRDRISSILNATGASTYECYLTGKGNYRERVATIQKYKGNRDGFQKPFHYQNIYDYIVKYLGGFVVDGIEADDALAIRQLADPEEDTVICSRDKDLRQIPGKHYSWSAGKQVEKPVQVITEYEGDFNLYCQLLTGDNTVDNILGCPAIGPVKAKKALAGSKDAEEMYQRCLDVYYDVFGWLLNEDGEIHYTAWDGTRVWVTIEEICEENLILLRMLRSEEEAEVMRAKW